MEKLPFVASYGIDVKDPPSSRAVSAATPVTSVIVPVTLASLVKRSAPSTPVSLVSCSEMEGGSTSSPTRWIVIEAEDWFPGGVRGANGQWVGARNQIHILEFKVSVG